MIKYFEYADEKSAKFWQIETNDRELKVSFGKVGSKGQQSTRTFADETACAKEAEKLIKEKTKKGYVEKTTKITTEIKKAPKKPVDKENDMLNKVIEKFSQDTTIPYLELKDTKLKKKETTGLLESKFGGTPYLPPGFEYPYYKYKDEKYPLQLLAQLNFEQLPHLDGFPEKGILQFYVLNETLYGMDDEDLTDQHSFRIVYHENIIKDETKLQSPPKLKYFDGDFFPIHGEYRLSAEISSGPMTDVDFRFNKSFMKVYKEHIDTKAKDFFDLDNKTYEKVTDIFYSDSHRIGGYPNFSQEDPRMYTKKFQNHTVLLLQVVSTGPKEIQWGDAGLGNFFIKPEDLKKRDFSNVIYYWDCL